MKHGETQDDKDKEIFDACKRRVERLEKAERLLTRLWSFVGPYHQFECKEANDIWRSVSNSFMDFDDSE